MDHGFRLHLEPLPGHAIRQLLEGLVPGMPEAVTAKITAHAGGIPLYAVEIVRSLVDKELVVSRDGVYRLEGDVEDLDVPTTLTAVIAARLDGLSPDERELVQGLAVLGDSFHGARWRLSATHRASGSTGGCGRWSTRRC